METDYEKFFEWLLKGMTSVRQLRRRIKSVMRKTANPAFKSVMVQITVDEAYAEELLGLDKPDYAY